MDLKIEDFKPEFAGKMNFYLSVVDDQLRHEHDQPSIGIVLCKGKNNLIVEYALRDTNKPMGVAQYQLTPGEADRGRVSTRISLDVSGQAPDEIERALSDLASAHGLERQRFGIRRLLEELVLYPIPVSVRECAHAHGRD